MKDSIDIGLTIDERLADGYYYSKTMRNALRDIRAIEDKNEAMQKLSSMTAMIDKLAKRGMIHKNKAANLKSGLAKKINAL